ncbi:MAG: hypothetical protein IJ571_04570 [Ruminococcus sp.]|nr:hypothetical protein [Ruminococcus sp.]
MAKTIVTQFGEMLNYDNIVKISVVTNWEDAEISKDGTISPDFEMIGRDITGTDNPMGVYDTPEDAENAVKALYKWLSSEAYSVYEIPQPQGADN